MKEVKAIIQPSTLEAVLTALKQIPELPGITVSEVKGFGRRRAADAAERVTAGVIDYVKKAKLEIVVPDELLEQVIKTIEQHAHRGKPGDGKIFVSKIEDVIKVRTGERGEQAI